MNKFMKMAYREALSNITGKEGGPFGAVIVKDNKVIARAHNQVLLRGDPTAHAEVMAIRKACKKLKTVHLEGCELYATSKPCPMCKGAIQWSNIKTVYYSGGYDETAQMDFGDREFDEDFQKTEEGWRQIDRERFSEIGDAFAGMSEHIHY